MLITCRRKKLVWYFSYYAHSLIFADFSYHRQCGHLVKDKSDCKEGDYAAQCHVTVKGQGATVFLDNLLGALGALLAFVSLLKQ